MFVPRVEMRECREREREKAKEKEHESMYVCVCRASKELYVERVWTLFSLFSRTGRTHTHTEKIKELMNY